MSAYLSTTGGSSRRIHRICGNSFSICKLRTCLLSSFTCWLSATKSPGFFGVECVFPICSNQRLQRIRINPYSQAASAPARERSITSFTAAARNSGVYWVCLRTAISSFGAPGFAQGYCPRTLRLPQSGIQNGLAVLVFPLALAFLVWAFLQ